MANRSLIFGIIIGVMVLSAGVLAFFRIGLKPVDNLNATNASTNPVADVKTFASVDEFRTYLATVATATPSSTRGSPIAPTTSSGFQIEDIGSSVGLGASETKASTGVNRLSTTNVQVAGIDEPDIVKTDGKSLFISNEQQYVYGTGIEPQFDVSGKLIPPTMISATAIVSTLPPEDAAKIGSVPETGDLLLVGQTLVVIGNRKLTGYDASIPSKPVERWSKPLADATSVETARLKDGTLYLVTRNDIDDATPCPLRPFSSGTFVVPCTAIYHPVRPTSVDTTFTVMTINPADGSLGKTVSFLGSGANTVVMMSDASLYVTNDRRMDEATTMLNFTNTVTDLVPQNLRDRLAKLVAYDISADAKQTEVGVLFAEYERTLTSDARLKFETELTNRGKTYAKDHLRDFTTTDIVKVDLGRFAVSATGSVPGSPLNQFSLDESKGSLRIATTSADSVFWSADSVSDVYVLDGTLHVIGSVRDLGKSERIYSARFIGDRGYVVTFRQTDPFYVLDLSDPSAPELAGQLKIPGYSSYLHPISDTVILGVGEENSRVKMTLFDVSNPNQPTELSTYRLDEYWTAVSETQHAFLQDPKAQVVFIPGSRGGYVVSYSGNQLKLATAVALVDPQRSVYINDTLYVVGRTMVRILRESDWQTVKDVPLTL